ncbi:hypothetical protein [Sporosarcina sp. FSL W7-1283]|uniref:hypothetical protein n=1 Tax=Sporosarcina sp. FSL W7-1283 TaxID=2921560 RepID=UPI0030F6D263
MINKAWIFSVFTLLSITMLLIYDFFPELNKFLRLSTPIFIGLFLMILLSGFYLNRIKNESSLPFNLAWQVTLTSYLFILIIVFILLGGDSQVGISLSNPVLWIVLMFTVVEDIRQYRKMKNAQSNLTP